MLKLVGLELHGTTLAQANALNADAPSAWTSPGANAFASGAMRVPIRTHARPAHDPALQSSSGAGSSHECLASFARTNILHGPFRGPPSPELRHAPGYR